MLGGGYRMVVRGSGIALSVVGRGVVTLDGDPRFTGDDAGVYSLDGVDCSVEPQSCVPLPTEPQRFRSVRLRCPAQGEERPDDDTVDDPRRRGRDLDRVVRLRLSAERRDTRSRRRPTAQTALVELAGETPALDRPRSQPPRQGRRRALPAHPQELRRPDPHAHRARRGHRQDHRARGRRGRLHDEAVQPARARRAGQERPSPGGARTALAPSPRSSGTATSRSTPGKREVYVGDDEIRLAPKEFDLLWELLDHRGHRAHARPAARARLGLHVRRRHAHGRRARPPDPAQARRRVADRHRVGRRLQGRVGAQHRPRPREPRRTLRSRDARERSGSG